MRKRPVRDRLTGPVRFSSWRVTHSHDPLLRGVNEHRRDRSLARLSTLKASALVNLSSENGKERKRNKKETATERNGNGNATEREETGNFSMTCTVLYMHMYANVHVVVLIICSEN